MFLSGPLGGLFGLTCLVSITSSVSIRYEYPNLLYVCACVYSALGSWASINVSVLLFYFAYILPSQILWFLFLSMTPAILVWFVCASVMKKYSRNVLLEIERRITTPVVVSVV